MQGDATNVLTLAEIITEVKTGVSGVLSIAAEGFNFIVGNPLCMFMLSLSFAGAALGFVKRAFKTSRA